MIPDTARYHGSFFSLLFDKVEGAVSVQKIAELGSGFFILNDKFPLYLKFSSRRNGPWTFNFFRSHQESVEMLFRQHGECFICLICGKDGVVGLSVDEMRQILDQEFEEQEAVSVSRKINTMYVIKGRNGTLPNRIGRGTIFSKIQEALGGN